jgi:DNA-binding transcriptional LysR family regulator
MVVEHRGIANAAASLNIAKSAVSRRLRLLEDRYSTKLIDRSPGRWEVTETGRELFQRASRAVHDFQEIETDFKSTYSDITGPLSISVPRDFGISFLSRLLVTFNEKYPEIQLTADFDDRVLDLERENYDFAIRITPDIDKKLISEKIGTVRHQLCAAPSYLKKYGQPTQLKDLRVHRLLHFGTAKRGTWALASSESKKTSNIDFNPTLNSNCGQFLFEATLQGQGIANLPDFIFGETLETGKLIHVLPQYQISDFSIYLVHSEQRQLNRRMRLFAAEIKEACKMD